MNNNFRQQVKQQFEKNQLDDTQLDRLQQILNKQPSSPRVEEYSEDFLSPKAHDFLGYFVNFCKKGNNIKRLGISVAAAALMVMAVHLSYFSAYRNLPLEIAKEVAKNHIKMKPLEVNSDQISDLRRYFTQLDFLVASSTIYPPDLKRLLGGRYCSIQGETAAQLRFRGGENNNSTLYEVPYDEEIFGFIPHVSQGEKPQKMLVKGLSISLWVEKGLLMVSVESID